MVVDGYLVEERVLVGAHGLRDTAADGPFLRFGAERVTRVWLNLRKGRTYDDGATNASIRLDCEPRFVEGPDAETSWRLCSTNRHYDHEWAGGRGFTTGPNPTGYTISGLGVDIDAQSGTLDPVADIYAAEAFSTREGARDPQSPLASYQATAGIGGSPDRFAPRTAVSEELHVEPGRTYVAYFQGAANGYYETLNASPGEDPGTEAGQRPARSSALPRAPGFVNAGFLELFPDSLPRTAPLVVRSNGPPSADPFGDDLEGDGQQPWPECVRGAVSAGLSLVVYEGGSVDELEACARSMEIIALYALQEGVYLSYILGAPAFVNQPFGDVFADGLPFMTPLVARSEGQPGGR